MSNALPKMALLLGFILVAGTLYAQQPGVDCAPIQGQGWTGCAPMNPSQQSSQGRQSYRPPERWQDNWGAIATDATRGSFGASTDMPTQGSAEGAALAACQLKGGMKCKIETRYRNACAAMVAGDTGYNVGSAITVSEAIQTGIKICTDAGSTNCYVYYAACSLPVRIQ